MKMFGIYVWTEKDGVQKNIVRMAGTWEDVKHITQYYIREYGYHMNVVKNGKSVFTF